MYRVETHKKLDLASKREVDALIYLVWATESLENSDVRMLAQPGQNNQDPLDLSSVHVLVRGENDELAGYGRVTVAKNPDDLYPGFVELGVIVTEFPVAYISRLVVRPDVRGRGIASMIHKTRIDIATGLGARVIYGWAVGEKPRGALSRFGFKESKVRTGFNTTWYETRREARLVKLDMRLNARAPFAVAT